MNLARTPQQVGNFIRRRRKNLGLSQTELSRLVGIQQNTVSLIESGRQAARLDTLLSILSALQLEMLLDERKTGDHSRIEDIF